MGYDLMNYKGGEFRFTGWAWSPVLGLAELYGWEPMGTVVTEGSHALLGAKDTDTVEVQESIKSWEGSYNSNNCQIVVEEDALNLAHALMNAVKELPDEKSYVDNDSIPTREWLINKFSGLESKKYLEKFIQFCKDGAFVIG